MSGIVTLTLNPTVDIFTSVERIEPEHKLRCDQERRDPGGGGINVARVIRRLGGDVLALYPAGGTVGQSVNDLLAREKVHTHAVPIAGSTRENFTVVERCSGKEFRFVLPGPWFDAASFQALVGAIEALEPAPSFLVLSGSLPPDAPTDAYAQLAQIAAGRGVKVALDASGSALQKALDAGVYLVKPSVRELEQLAGRSLPNIDSILSAARSIVDSRKAAMLVATMGAKGALLVSSGRTLVADAIPVKVMSAVGAGDSLMAGLIHGLHRGDELADAFSLGIAAATASLLVRGTQLCSREDALRISDRVRVRALVATDKP